MKLPSAPSQQKKQSAARGGTIVVNKMFADYDTAGHQSRASCPIVNGMDSFVEEDEWRDSDATTMTTNTRMSSREVEMGRIISTDSSVITTTTTTAGASNSDGWALM